MSSEIDKILSDLKNKNPSLHKEIIDKKISINSIYDNLPAIIKYLNEKESKQENTIEFYFNENNELKWDLKLTTKELKQLKEIEIAKKFIEKNYSEEKVELDLNKDVEKNVNRKEILTFIKTIIMTFPEAKGYWLYGDFGVGKTHITISLLNHLVKSKNITVSHLLLSEVIARIKSSFSEGSNLFSKIFNDSKNVDVLVLDDIGGEPMSEWARDEFLFPLLNYRMENKKMTLFTSNLKRKQYHEMLINKFKNTFDENLKISRLMERIKALSFEIELKGKNWRN